MVANRAQDGLGNDASEITLLDDAGTHALPKMDMLNLAWWLAGEIAKHIGNDSRTADGFERKWRKRAHAAGPCVPQEW